MALGNVAISLGNYWQGIVAERAGYATALYLDAGIVVLALALVPFLRSREPGTAPLAEARAPS
jgi:hypothetical protein